MTTANIITISRILLVPIFIFFLININLPSYDLISAFLFLFISLTDFLDGYIARKYKQITNFGKFLDPLADKILITSALVVLVGLGRLNSVITVIIIAREFLVTSIRLIASNDGAVISASLSGKLKTISQIVAIMAIILEKYLKLIYPLPYSDIFVWVMLILTLYSGIEYAIVNRKLIKFE
jgi:CDP-diacylglycerol--glycerol-3-phosphate 3-phosphatidyltransferase